MFHVKVFDSGEWNRDDYLSGYEDVGDADHRACHVANDTDTRTRVLDGDIAIMGWTAGGGPVSKRNDPDTWDAFED